MKRIFALLVLGITSLSVFARTLEEDSPSESNKTHLFNAESLLTGAEGKPGLHELSTALYASNSARTGYSQRPRRIVLGGTLGMSFGNYTNVNIAPQVGFRVNQYFTVGGGVSYNYYNHKDRDYTLNYFGMHLYTRIYPVRFISLYAQPELQRRWGTVRGEKSESELFACLLLGGGVVLPVSPSGGITFTVYYDVLQNAYTPHGNKIGYSVGYVFGF